VLFIIKRDLNDVFRFVALQSKVGQEICNYIGVDPNKMDSIILYEPGLAYYYKSEAALKMVRS
jgi:predicted DCC family thiol-disulfide oxidoreductase YuxK